MRLLFFTQAFLPTVGGAERFLDQLARRLVARGHDVTVLAARQRGVDNHLDVPYRLLRYRKPFSKRWFPRHTILYLLRAHRSARPEIVHAHGAYPQGYAVELYARWMGLPYVVRPIGYDIQPGERIQSEPQLARRAAQVLLRADRVVAQSLELAVLVGNLGVARERIVRIPNAVDTQPYARVLEQRALEPTVVALGIFFKKKGFDILLEAFARVRELFPRARLVLAGDGVERIALENQARELGVSAAVSFPGLLEGDAKVACLQRAWVFVSSSRREPFSNANLEALAAGLPIVATAVGGNREIVTPEQNGILVPPEDPLALAGALARVLGDSGLRERMGQAARRRALDYGWDEVVERYESLYREVSAGKR